MHNDDQFSRLFDLSESGKRFSQLNSEEQALVMDVMGSGEEYDAMLAMQPAMEKAFTAEPELEPDKEMRRAVLGVPQRSRQIWLNSFWLMIWPADMPLYRRPAFQFASVAALVALVWVAATMNPTGNEPQVADNMKKESDAKADESTKEDLEEATAEADFDTMVEPLTSDVRMPANELSESVPSDQEMEPNANRRDQQASTLAATAPVEITGDVYIDNQSPAKANYFSKEDAMADDGMAATTGSACKDANLEKSAEGSKSLSRTEDRAAARQAVPGAASRNVPATAELIDLLYTAY